MPVLSTLYHAVPRPLRWVLILGVLWALGYYALPWSVPLPPALMQPIPMGRMYLASDGTPLRHLLNEAGQRVAEPVTFADIPERLLHATLAAEDKRFFKHGGIDFLATTRAFVENTRSQRVTSGASTITQQLIKISADEKRPRNITTKLIEMLQARRLEMTWTKEEIVAAYVNRLPYGNLFLGCAAASRGYFNKPMRDLTFAECAFLAALPQAPGRLNPFRDPAPALKRQKLVLERMKAAGWIEREDYDVATGQQVRLAAFHGGFIAPHAVGLLEATPPTENIVRTTIDAALQKQVERIIGGRLEGLRARHVEHAAAVVIENATGHVLALTGSRDYQASSGGQINGAWTPRSPGSALKPFTYALAFQRGFTPGSVIPDLPVEFQTKTGLYKPENYDLKAYGPVTTRVALGNSLNISAVRVLREAGGTEALQKLLQDLGISTLTEDADHYGLGLTIGNAPVRLLELTNAYAALARLGEYRSWSLLPSSEDANKAKSVRLIERQACWWLADILSDNQARVMTFGANSPLRMPFKVAVKTGTSTSYRDNWTLGYTPRFTVGVWAGNFEGQPMNDVSGVTGAAPILRDIFHWLDDRHNLTWYSDQERPDTLVQVRIDPRNGRRLAPRTPPPRMTREEWLPKDHLPPVATSGDYEPKTGRALQPMDYAAWIDSPDNWLGDLVTCLPRGLPAEGKDTRAMPLRIIQPTDGLVIRLDPDLPSGNRLLLQAMPATEVHWRSETLKIERMGAQTFALLVPGEHTITAAHHGEERSARVTVKEP